MYKDVYLNHRVPTHTRERDSNRRSYFCVIEASSFHVIPSLPRSEEHPQGVKNTLYL